ncbi:TIR domain-containing protein [Kitasatospora sp. NPDC008050]|uniref:TIR domain-containing protein n=1 Tax=Kitasatospora sp. NPDC008050 TaxID=3364021 RepID=UPI0036EAE23C
MPEIFVNYRTGDGEESATTIERELSRRFGTDRVFRAGKSIQPGRRFPKELITAVRRSRVLIAVIGEGWTAARTAAGGPALDDPDDWTRREILEAFESGALVVPVLVGRNTRLSRAELPAELAELADCQYRRLDMRNADADLARIGDDLAEAIPELAAVDADRGAVPGARRVPQGQAGQDAQSGPDSVRNQAGDVHGRATQGRDHRNRQRDGVGQVEGDLGTFINHAGGPVHTGSGDQHNPQFHGDGVNYAEGDQRINQRFGSRRERRDDGR